MKEALFLIMGFFLAWSLPIREVRMISVITEEKKCNDAGGRFVYNSVDWMHRVSCIATVNIDYNK
jgi:hypothetical protein